MATALDLCNRALLNIGARAQVSSISPSDGSPEADACAILYTPTFEALARTANWNCLRQQATLSLLKAAKGTPENPNGTTTLLPPTPWLYSYALPSDSLRLRYIVPSFAADFGGVAQTSFSNSVAPRLSGGGQIQYAVAYDTDADGNPIQVVLTNQAQAQAVYTVNQPNPIIWDSQFQSGMVASLAAYLVPALSLHMGLMAAQTKLAEGIIAQARVTDGDESVVTMDHLPDFIRARLGEGHFVGLWGRFGFDNMNWPG